MAEFVEVMKQKARMCEAYINCNECALQYPCNGTDDLCRDFVCNHPERAEKIIMEWVATHPEPRYPSWNEAWKQLFPKAYYSNDGTDVNCPCVKFFIPPGQVKCAGMMCGDCVKKPIPADIAEKLGIKPLEGGNDRG